MKYFLGHVLASVAILLLVAQPASAEGHVERGTPKPQKQHNLYLGLLGKGGMYSLGYQYQWRDRFALGVAASAFRIDFETLVTVVPYAFGTPIERGNHALFVDMGPVFSRHHTESPVELLSDETNYRLGAELSAGYQYQAGRFVVRPYLMAQFTRSLSGWLGIDLGVRFR